ncbi:MAG TPA: 2-oxo acid dehydrogenase subunit E2 [Anaerolineales bacterium]|nr:2-oxo acid dehydrogenase subunit E2 [Anaerolineales bacterium]
MNAKTIPYHVVDLTPGRRIWLNTLELSWTAHAIYGLLEVDVTTARKYIAEHRNRTGESLSFTAFLAICLACAVEEHKEVQACLKGRRQMVMFDDVNIGLMVEHKAGGKGALMGHVIQAANHKTYREIHEEIRSVQSAPVPSGRGMPSWFRSAMLLPWPFSSLVMALLRMNRRRDPLSFVSMGGTVAITSVGMFGGSHSGWGLTPTPQSLGLVVGGIAWKPAVVEGRIEPREILNLTVMFDHDVVDGAPATRFTRRLVELIESGYGLDKSNGR